MNPIRTTRPFWLSWPTLWYLAGVAGLVFGAAVLVYAPEWAIVLKEWML